MQTTVDASTPGPAIEEAFVADRMAFWGWFTSFVMGGGIAIAVLLALLAFFLT